MKKEIYFIRWSATNPKDSAREAGISTLPENRTVSPGNRRENQMVRAAGFRRKRRY